MKKRFLPLIALLVLSLAAGCVPAHGQEAAPVETPAAAASETGAYGMKTEAVMERKTVPYVTDFLLALGGAAVGAAALGIYAGVTETD